MWQACALVFISSACVLVIELIAGRIMAPYVGVSLYTWTSIIGIVLAGMSVGNYLGGVVADRHASRHTLGVIFVAGSVSCLLILVITDLVIGQTFRLSLLPRIVVYTTAIFLLPSLVLGMVSPLVVKLALADLQRTGNTVGTIYAFSTAGSIVGTFLTGFWLISWLGTRSIVWIVAGVLLLTGLIVGQFHRSKGLRHRVTGLAAPVLAIVTFAFVRAGWNAGQYHAPCEVESNYYCIQIVETFEAGRPAHALMLDRLIHSFVVLDDPTVLGYGYERAYAELDTGPSHWPAADEYAVHRRRRLQLSPLRRGDLPGCFGGRDRDRSGGHDNGPHAARPLGLVAHPILQRGCANVPHGVGRPTAVRRRVR